MQRVGSVNLKTAPTQEARLLLKAYTGFLVLYKTTWPWMQRMIDFTFQSSTLKDSSCPTAPPTLVLLIRQTQHHPNKVNLFYGFPTEQLNDAVKTY